MWLNDLREHADENVSIICEWISLQTSDVDQCCPDWMHATARSSITVVANKTDLCSSPSDATTSTPISSENDNSESPDPAEASPTPKSPTSSQVRSPRSPRMARAVSTAEGKHFAELHNLLYVETSAKEGWNVVQAFERTAGEVLMRLGREEMARRRVSLGSGAWVLALWCAVGGLMELGVELWRARWDLRLVKRVICGLYVGVVGMRLECCRLAASLLRWEGDGR